MIHDVLGIPASLSRAADLPLNTSLVVLTFLPTRLGRLSPLGIQYIVSTTIHT